MTAVLPPAQYRNLREMVASYLRQAILDGALKPGQKLMEVEIASQMGISRTPVREALRQLEKDGLVRSIPNRGTVVRDLTDNDLVHLYGIRAVLEGLAARWACERISEDEIGRLRRLCLEMRALLPRGSEEDRVEFLRKDVEFHELLISAARSRQLTEALSAVQLQIRMVMAAVTFMGGGSERSADYHEMTLDAIVRKDADAAEELARRQVEESLERIIRMSSIQEPADTPQ